MYGQLAFLAGLAALTGVLLYWSFSQDRVLGVIVAVSLVLRVAGSVAFTWYLDMQGKEFFSDDEMAYLQTGQLIVAEWQSNVQYEAPSEQVVSLGGGYPLWNAFLIWLWGPSLLPMRLANGLVGTMGVLIAFHLGQHLFPGQLAGRAAARRAESVIDCLVSLESSGDIPGCADFRDRAGISLDHEKFWAGSLWNVHGLLGVSRLHPQLLCRRARLAVLDGIPLTASGAAPV